MSPRDFWCVVCRRHGWRKSLKDPKFMAWYDQYLAKGCGIIG